MHILVVEDDIRLSDYLRLALRRENHSVDVCTSLEELDTYFLSTKSETPQIIILDRMLGREDGAKKIPSLKKHHPDIGILVLSSLDLPAEKAQILDAGADEYLCKPFSLEELCARLRLISRRYQDHSHQPIHWRHIGNLSLDPQSHNALVGSKKLDLTRKEFQLLHLFLESPGRVYNRFQILDRVWDMESHAESNVVETAIKNLRRKLEDFNCSAKIENKRNVGYWIEA